MWMASTLISLYGWTLYSNESSSLLSIEFLALILFLEIAWFFGGKRPSLQEGSITVEETNKRKLALYERLFDHYEEEFPNGILTAKKNVVEDVIEMRPSTSAHLHHRFDEEDANSQIVYWLSEQLRERGVHVTRTQIQVLESLVNEKHVLLENPNYHYLSQFLFSGIHQTLIRGKKMIVIVNDEKEIPKVEQWINEGFRNESEGFQYIWEIVPLETALKQNGNADILIVTVGQLLYPSLFQFIKSNVDVTKYEMVLYVEASEMLSKYDLVLHNFINKLENYLGKMPQQIILSKWYEGLEEEVREVLRIKPTDISMHLDTSPNLFYIVWKKEFEQTLQKKVLPKLTHRRLDAEAVISLPAVKYGVDEILIGNQEQSATDESIQELLDNRKNLEQYGVAPYVLGDLEQKITIVDSVLEGKQDDHRFIIVKDRDRHFINTLMDWWTLGELNTFVHIVAPPYLLRDYFAANTDFFLENSEKISPIIPELSDTKWSMGYVLLEHLSESPMEQNDLQFALEQIFEKNGEEEPIVVQLNRLIREIFQVDQDIQPFIEVVESESFDIKTLEFEPVIHYQLSKRFYREMVPSTFQFYEVVTQTGEAISEIIAGNIHQQYLPGQIHAFHGSQYKIESIDHFKKRIELSYESQTEKYYYKQDRNYHFLSELNHSGNREQLQIDQNKLTFSMASVEMKVETNGYFIFEEGIRLFDEQTGYKPIPESERNLYERNYRNANVLLLEWEKSNGGFENPNEIAVTLVFLLNELFVTLFPHGHPGLTKSYYAS